MTTGGSSAYACAIQSPETHSQHTGGGTGRTDSQSPYTPRPPRRRPSTREAGLLSLAG